MCEFLVKAIDARMPTIAEWRADLASQFPAAKTFLAEHEDVPKSIEDERRLAGYVKAKKKLNLHERGKSTLSKEEREAMKDKVDAYEVAPLSTEEIGAVSRNFYIEMGPDGSPLLTSKPSIEAQWRYYNHLINVDSRKTDDEKRVELETKDRRGCYKAGDPIECLEDGTAWGTKDGPPLAYIVKVPGLPVAEGRKYLEASPDGRRRRFSISPDGTITDKLEA